MNFIWGLVFLPVVFIGFIARAETHYLLVDGGTSSTSNYVRFYNAVLRGYETAKFIGSKTTVIAKDGTWKVTKQNPEERFSDFALTPSGKTSEINNGNPAYPPIQFPAKDIQNLEQAIQSFSASNGDKIVIYITPHGYPPTDKNAPETATIGFWGKEYSYKDLETALAKFPNVKFKLVTTACNAGGVHSLARNLGNVCTTALVSYFNPSSSGYWHEYPFDVAFWKNVQTSRGRTSMADASLDGLLAQNQPNPEQGQFSSFDFVDFTLKTGQYSARKFDMGPNMWVTDRLWQVHNPSGYSGFLASNTIKSTAFTPSLTTDCSQCCTNPVQQDIARIERLARTLNEIAQQAVVQDLEKKADRQPAQVRTIFHDAINDMKKNGARYAQIAQEYDRKFQDLKRRWDEAKGKSGNNWKTAGTARAQLQRKFDELKVAAERDLKQYSFNHQMLERLDRLEEFNKKATAEQKRKFVQLLQCEWEPL